MGNTKEENARIAANPREEQSKANKTIIIYLYIYMSKYPNYDIRSKHAMKLVVGLFKAIERGDDISSINDILDQLIAERMHGIDINNYRFNLELYRNSQVGISEDCIVMPASKDWSKGISPIHFMIWCLQEETDAYLPNSDKIIFSLLMHGVKVGGTRAREHCYGWLKQILEDDMLDNEEETIQIVTNIINYLKMSETLTKKIRKKQRKRPKSGSNKPKRRKSKRRKSKRRKSKKRTRRK